MFSYLLKGLIVAWALLCGLFAAPYWDRGFEEFIGEWWFYFKFPIEIFVEILRAAAGA